MKRSEFLNLPDDEKFERLFDAGAEIEKRIQSLADQIQNLHERLHRLETKQANA